jgi:peroxiredoxin
MSQLQAKNAVVFGISTDTVESHKRFAEKERLNFLLLADPEKKMTADYGVLGPGGYANRVTFIIGPDGKIAGIDRAVNAQFERGPGKLTTRHADNLALLLSDWKAQIDKPIPNFSLPALDGKTVQVLPPGKKAAAIVFLSARCPVSNAYHDRLKALAADPAYKDVAFLGLDSNADEKATEVKQYVERQPLAFPVAKDAGNVLADHFKARTTPTVWVIDARGAAVYGGAIDDNKNPVNVKVHYLKDALDAVLAGTKAATQETKSPGCPIKRAPKK